MGTALLSPSQLKEYITNIKNLEISCYQLNRLSEQLNSRLNRLSHEINAQPEKPPAGLNAKEGIKISDIIFFMITLVIGAVVCGVLSIPISGIYYLFNSGEGFWDNFIGGGCDESFDPYLFTGIKIGIVVGVIGVILLTILGNNIEKKDIVAYKQRERKRQDVVQIAQQNYNLLQQEFRKCQQTYQKTANTLEQYYSLNVIFPKYRGLVPICTISEYLESGRCSTLTGHEGAYNLYESELRMNLILGKLDDIIYRLDDVRDQQYNLYRAITDSNSKIDNMCALLDETRQNTALTQYYSAISAANTSYLAWKEFVR